MSSAFRGALVVCALLTAASSSAQNCSSPDPAQWPSASKPYFLVIADTSGSMTNSVSTPSSCGLGNTRLDHMRCSLRAAVQAYGGQVNFGLATFAVTQTGCTPTGPSCSSTCTFSGLPSEVNTRGTSTGCGPRTGPAATSSGALIRVGVQQDNFWSSPPSADNVPVMLSWVDASCQNNTELFASGNTPLNGVLRDAKRYFQGTYIQPPVINSTLPSPLTPQDRACRPVNVLLITDGDETCDTQLDAVQAATDLFQNGVTVGGRNYKVLVHVINFVGASQANTDALAAAGGTTTSYSASNEAQLSASLFSIIGSTVRGESCNNADDNCNGCVDEGFAHACNQGQTCCAWATAGQRTTCENTFKASISTANPAGNLALLPCVTAAQATASATWSCFDPGDACDGVDNDCDGEIDEGQLRCGSPAHCPQVEVCNGLDDDCDGTIDEGVCTTCAVAPRSETCNGCDDDCNGLVDDAVSASLPCGPSGPNIAPNCVGQVMCRPPVSVAPGTCTSAVAETCSNTPLAETCDGLDNDCDGLVDENLSATACEPPGTTGLSYAANSHCERGLTRCRAGAVQCEGFVGPAVEVCNGVDDDCDGDVDEGATDSAGHVAGAGCCAAGTTCGIGACSQGVWTCGGDRLTCVGGVGPSVETCNGIDDDCDGVIDETATEGAFCTTDAGTLGRTSCDADAGATRCLELTVCEVPDAGPPIGGGGGSMEIDAGSTGGGTAEVDAGPTGGGTADVDAGPMGGGTMIGGSGCGCSSGEGLPLFAVAALLLFVRRRQRTALVAAAALSVFAGCSSKTDDIGSVKQTLGAEYDCYDAGCGDTQIDPANCGACGQSCTFPNGIAACSAGHCVLTGCQSGHANLDRIDDGGCEVACPGADGGAEICDGVDNDCNGAIDDGYSLGNDVNHCGACGTACGNAEPNARYGCDGGCVFLGCQQGFITSADGGAQCAVGCTPTSANESCNGLDDDCDGLIDEDVSAAPSQVCGVSTFATANECRAYDASTNPNGVSASCIAGAWQCTFHQASVCGPNCATAAEVCDGLDNDCDGKTDETFPNLGVACASDDGVVPGHGPCRTTGTFVCSGLNATACSATKDLSQVSAELCDGVDNDCDGVTDESFTAKGLNATYFVKPAVTKIAANVWIASYEASRPLANATSPGSGNGYFAAAPGGVPPQKTPACSVPGRLPWVNATALEAEQTCAAIGGRLCSTAEWQNACRSVSSCQYGYAPRGPACLSAFTATKFCNLGNSFDFDATAAGDQDGLLPTASSRLNSCYADWSGLQGNSAATDKVYDLLGNAREMTRNAANDYRVLGGSYVTRDEAGGSCSFALQSVQANTQTQDTTFRCCFSADPSL